MTTETVLIVDDEEPVRRTFREWLTEANLGVDVLTAPDAETALTLANEHPIDLAILDWNLGAGQRRAAAARRPRPSSTPTSSPSWSPGSPTRPRPLKPRCAWASAITSTRTRTSTATTFLAAVRKQLDRIRPAKRERQLHTGLVAFREAVEKVLPLARSAAALNDPLSPPEAISSLFRFLLRFTGATDGVLLVRRYDEKRSPAEECRAYDVQGKGMAAPTVAFSRSLAGAVFSMGGAQTYQQAGGDDGRMAAVRAGAILHPSAPLPGGKACRWSLNCSTVPAALPRRIVSSSRRHPLSGAKCSRCPRGSSDESPLLDAVAAALEQATR